MDQTTIDQAVS